MKKLPVLFILFSLIKPLYAQQIKILTPLVTVWDISDSAKRKFEKAEKIFSDVMSEKRKHEDLTEYERRLFDAVDETQEHFYQTIGGGCSWYCGGGPDSGYATSHLSSYKDINYTAEKTHDFDVSTAWVEGIKGHGTGEKITFVFRPKDPPVTTVKVYNGYMKSEKAWKENSRVRTLKMYVDGKPYALLHLQDITGCQEFITDTLSSEDKPMLLTFEIYDVYPGSKYDETAISEINFDGTGVHCFAAGTLVKMGDGSEKPIEKITIGEKVLSYDFTSNTLVTAKVSEIPSVKHHNLIEITTGSGALIATDDHPFYVEGKGWCAFNPGGNYAALVNIGKLEAGDLVKTVSGTDRIKSIATLNLCQSTYSLIINGADNFYVNGLLVRTSE